ncbi:MAG: hypothetical protein MJ072_05830, partial [Clostridia bacterium]|nr:hypothetical protein [Clostridia bacterium]
PFITLNKKNVDVTVQKDGDGLIINLVNLNQSRHSLEYTVYDEVPTVENVEITVHRPFKKAEMPLGERFYYETDGESLTVKLPSLHIHSVIRLAE